MISPNVQEQSAGILQDYRLQAKLKLPWRPESTVKIRSKASVLVSHRINSNADLLDGVRAVLGVESEVV